MINQLKLSANINYTELFLNNQEGFFINKEKITSIYPIHSNLTLIQGSQITYSSNLIQCYINNTFSKKYNVSIHDKGYLKMLVDNNHINFEYEIIGIVKDTNIFDKFYIDNQQIEMIFTQTIMNTNNETLLQYIQKKSSYFINYHLSFRDFHDYLVYENAIIIIDDNYKLELQLTLYNQYQSKIQNDQKYERFYTFAMYFSMISFIIFLIYFLYDFLHHFYHSLYSLKKLQHSYKQMIIYFILLFAPLFIIQIWLFHYLLFIFIIIDAIIYSYYLFFHKLKI